MNEDPEAQCGDSGCGKEWINGMPDHLHILIGVKLSCCISDLVREIKKSTNEFIKAIGFIKYQFHCQEGYEAFSYSHSNLSNVIGNINQKEHHAKITLKEEYISLLQDFNINYDENYLFQSP